MVICCFCGCLLICLRNWLVWCLIVVCCVLFGFDCLFDCCGLFGVRLGCVLVVCIVDFAVYLLFV